MYAFTTIIAVSHKMMSFAAVVPIVRDSVYTGWRKKTGPPAILSHCKYSENSMTELHGNWWTSAILYAEHSH